MSQPGDTTSITLLAKLREQSTDSAAWQDFVRRYRPRIYAHCVACALQPADAEDVTQAVLVKLIARMREFRYDPAQSFRAWLRTVTRNVLCDLMAERRRERGSGDNAVVRLLENLEAREGLANQVDETFAQELLDEAVRWVRTQVTDQHWEIFRLTAMDGLPGAETGKRLGISAATVYMIKSRVQKLVRQEIHRLESAPE
jgi:RNA polymerase sigma factor (sigma-70 family)